MEKLKDQKVQDQQMVGADELPEDALDQAAGGHIWDGGHSRSGQQDIA